MQGQPTVERRVRRMIFLWMDDGNFHEMALLEGLSAFSQTRIWLPAVTDSDATVQSQDGVLRLRQGREAQRKDNQSKCLNARA